MILQFLFDGADNRNGQGINGKFNMVHGYSGIYSTLVHDYNLNQHHLKFKEDNLSTCNKKMANVLFCVSAGGSSFRNVRKTDLTRQHSREYIKMKSLP